MARKSQPPALEWIIGALGALVFLGLVAITLTGALSPQTPPEIKVEVVSIDQTASGYVVQFKARNNGRITGAAVTVSATLERDGAVIEEREAQFDYIPGQSFKRGGFLFREDPRIGILSIDANGYADP